MQISASLVNCYVIQSILMYLSCNHTCSRTELLELQIIYFVSSLHKNVSVYFIAVGNFFSCSSETSCSFFPTIFYKSLKIFFPDPSPTAHLTLHTHLSLTLAHLKNIIPVISNHGNSYTLFTTNLLWSIFTHLWSIFLHVARIYANLLERKKAFK